MTGSFFAFILEVLFVRLIKKPNDHVSVRIVENKRDGKKIKQKTICCVGHTHKNNKAKIQMFKRLRHNLIRDMKEEMQMVFSDIPDSFPPEKKPLNEFPEGMVHAGSLKEENRISMGCSDIFGLAYEHREGIKGRICERSLSLFKESVDVVFFDVTTLYFESFVSDEIRRAGFSKDNKVKETQVLLALMTTCEGLPLGYELFPGNAYEGGTLIQAVQSMSSCYDIKDILVVADRGMFSRGNLLELDQRGVRFIVGARLRHLKSSERDRIFSQAPGFLKEGNLRRKAFWTGEFEKEGMHLIVSYDRKRADKDRAEREKILEKIRKKMKKGKVSLMDLAGNKGVKKYLKLERKGVKTACLDETRIEEDVLWNGFCGVITNHPIKKSGEVIDRYRNLWQIEAAFRLNKHDLKMRPIYHWTPKRIKAHVLICFIAYGLACFVRYSLKQSNIKLSFERLREELSFVQSSIVKDTKTGRRFRLPSRATATQRAIYGVFNKGGTIPFYAPREQVLVPKYICSECEEV